MGSSRSRSSGAPSSALAMSSFCFIPDEYSRKGLSASSSSPTSAEHLADPLPPVPALQSVQGGEEVQILPPGQPPVEGPVVGRQNPDPPANPRVEPCKRLAQNPAFSPIRFDQSSEDLDDGGLARAVGPEQAADLLRRAHGNVMSRRASDSCGPASRAAGSAPGKSSRCAPALWRSSWASEPLAIVLKIAGFPIALRNRCTWLRWSLGRSIDLGAVSQGSGPPSGASGRPAEHARLALASFERPGATGWHLSCSTSCSGFRFLPTRRPCCSLSQERNRLGHPRHRGFQGRARTPACRAARTAISSAILLKGLSLNFSRLRSMGDIDLLVPPTQLAEAIDALLAVEGYRYRRMDRDGPDPGLIFEHRLPERERRQVQAHISWNNEFQLLNPASGVLVELHHTPLQIRNPDGRFIENVDGVLRKHPAVLAAEPPRCGVGLSNPLGSAFASSHVPEKRHQAPSGK